MKFEVVPGDVASPCVIHVPHAATAIPPEVRCALLLDDDELARELRHMTDAGTDELAAAVAEEVLPRPWLFVNRLSRLVVDPERFPDDREEMRLVGMGAVYTRTSHGLPLRAIEAPAEQALIDSYFTPYSEALANLVDERLAATGHVTLIDLHSYPVAALPYELHADARRPEVCLGADLDHTPPELLARALGVFAPIGEVVANEPFAGTYVPLRHYGLERRVSSLMVELRRDTYLREDGSMNTPGARKVVAALNQLLAGPISEFRALKCP